MIIGVTGSTGLIGMALCEHLRGLDHTPLAIFRNEHGGFVIPQRLDGVIHLAGESIASGAWSEEKKTRIYDSRVTGTKNLITSLQKLSVPIKFFISASAVGIYGNRGDDVLTEESSPGDDFLAKVATDWEEAAKMPGVRSANARFGVVMSTRGGALKKMLPLFKFGLGASFGTGKQYLSWVSLQDAVRALTHLINYDSHGAYNVTAPTPLRNVEFSNKLAEICSRRVFFSIPDFILKTLLGEAAEVLLDSQYAVPKKLLAEGFVFTSPVFDEKVVKGF